MGNLLSRGNGGVEEVDISSSNAYRYPPKSGCYFGSHFIMGGEKFETTQPESYLFGENSDLNFLGNRPAPFPYPAPQAHEPTKTLKSLINIRKDSIRLVKTRPESNVESGDRQAYNVEFTFDSDVRVAITIYYIATEHISNGQAVYQARDDSMKSATFHYKRGANQTFSQPDHIIEPGKYSDEDWLYNPDKDVIPMVIQCIVEDEQHSGHSHASLASLDRGADGGFTLKALKQKQMVHGLYYLLQEIYGIENKSPERQKLDEELEDNGSECVICMSESRDTLILPCRHLCLCNLCADNLRYQANNCPICRAPFRALLQVRAMRKKNLHAAPPSQLTDGDPGVSQDGVPPGYQAVSLIEALNGPQAHSTSQPITHSYQAHLPPDDNSSAVSPAMKRKQKRSSSRSSRRRAAQQEAARRELAQNTTEGATALLAMQTLNQDPPASETTPLTSPDSQSARATHIEPDEDQSEAPLQNVPRTPEDVNLADEEKTNEGTTVVAAAKSSRRAGGQHKPVKNKRNAQDSSKEGGPALSLESPNSAEGTKDYNSEEGHCTVTIPETSPQTNQNPSPLYDPTYPSDRPDADDENERADFVDRELYKGENDHLEKEDIKLTNDEEGYGVEPEEDIPDEAPGCGDKEDVGRDGGEQGEGGQDSSASSYSSTASHKALLESTVTNESHS